jgi:hypothetical protein
MTSPGQTKSNKRKTAVSSKHTDAQNNTSEASTPLSPQNEEDYNIRSEKRTELLTKLKELTNGQLLSPALWGCFQLGNIECIEKVVKMTEEHKVMTDWIFSMNNPIQDVPLLCKYISFFYKRVIKTL